MKGSAWGEKGGFLFWFSFLNKKVLGLSILVHTTFHNIFNQRNRGADPERESETDENKGEYELPNDRMVKSTENKKQPS